MKRLKLLGIAAGMAALAACAKGGDENNMANADMNAADNLALPADNLETNVDMNAGTTNDTNVTGNDTNTTGNNTSDNTANAY